VTTIYPPFWRAVRHNLIWLAVTFLVATPLGMFLAVLLDKEMRGSRIYQTSFYLPVVLSLALVGFIWQLEAAKVDGANERTTFFKIVFPVLAPINIIVLVVSVIESLRAFDLVWVINKGRNGLELIATLVTQNIVGEASRIGFGSALATIMLLISSVFIAIYLRIVMREEQR